MKNELEKYIYDLVDTKFQYFFQDNWEKFWWPFAQVLIKNRAHKLTLNGKGNKFDLGFILTLKFFFYPNVLKFVDMH